MAGTPAVSAYKLIEKMKSRGHLPKPLSQFSALLLTAFAMGAMAKITGLNQSSNDRLDGVKNLRLVQTHDVS
jgi:hypothetical protein